MPLTCCSVTVSATSATPSARIGSMNSAFSRRGRTSVGETKARLGQRSVIWVRVEIVASAETIRQVGHRQFILTSGTGFTRHQALLSLRWSRRSFHVRASPSVTTTVGSSINTFGAGSSSRMVTMPE